VDLAPYDWTWNIVAVVLLAAGVLLLSTSRSAA
jgi:hypothetical protein